MMLYSRTPAVGVSRRGVLRAAGVGVLTMAVAGAGGLSYRAYDSNLLDSAHGHRLPQYPSGGPLSLQQGPIGPEHDGRVAQVWTQTPTDEVVRTPEKRKGYGGSSDRKPQPSGKTGIRLDRSAHSSRWVSAVRRVSRPPGPRMQGCRHSPTRLSRSGARGGRRSR